MTTNNSWNTPNLVNKGDLLGGKGSGSNPGVLTVGADGTVLTADSTQAEGVKWDVPVIGALDTLTADSPSMPVIPSGGNINTFGTGSITTTSASSTITTKLTGLTAHNVLAGAGTPTITNIPPSATLGVPLVSQGASADPSFSTALIAGGGTASTTFNINGAVYSNTTTTGALQSATLTSGQLLIGGTTAPAAASLTAGANITITPGNNSITIAATGGGTGNVDTLKGNTGPAVTPTTGNINTIGAGSITIEGAGDTLTTQLTGLTNHNVMVGTGTSTLTSVPPSATLGIPFISQGSTTDPLFGTALIAGGGTASTSFSANGVVISGTSTTSALISLPLTSGQIVIGGTTTPAAASLTAGTGISITPGNNSITIASTGGGGTLSTLTGNMGGAISPTTGNINTFGTGSIEIVGSGNTLTTRLTGLTAHNVLLGEGTPTVGLVAPSATAGVPLVSSGAAVDPAFGTAVVAGGGTGDTSFIAYTPICGGTTTTGALQSVASIGTSGQVLTSNGPAMLPTFQSGPAASVFSINTQVFTSSGTYTPTTGMKYVIVEVVGGGAGGGGCGASVGSNSASGGGGSGGYSRKTISAATIGGSQSVTIGALGAGGAAGNNNGGSGGTTSFGSGPLLQSTGGTGGGGAGATTGIVPGGGGGDGGVGSGGDVNTTGGPGTGGFIISVPAVGNLETSGAGGSSFFGGGGALSVSLGGTGSIPGDNANSYGGAGSGAVTDNVATGVAGGNGFGGICIVTEYIVT